MATKVLLNMYTALNGAQLSGIIKQSRLAVDAAQLDATAMGDGWTENAMGLFSETLTLELLDDFTDNALDELIWGYLLARANISFAVRPEDTTIGTGNPEYQGFITPVQFNMGGSVGELAMKSLTYPLHGAVTRDVSP